MAVSVRHLSSTASGLRMASTSETDSPPRANDQAWTPRDPGPEANSASTRSRIGSYKTGDATRGRAVENESSVHGPVSSTCLLQVVESAKISRCPRGASKAAPASGGAGGPGPLDLRYVQ